MDDTTIDKLEANINKLPPVSKMLADGMTPEEICMMALDGFHPEILDTSDVSYKCDCSRDRVERALRSLSPDDLYEMAGDTKDTEVECHFCDKKYYFTPKELLAMAKQREAQKEDPEDEEN